ncbi:MAG: lipid-A-disaccharide synthase N-terminal domain-containing protein [Flavobacteriaceae bacterium]|nr:lipid-A-disaccharide synthase N-terminal domain-containing protein [Flavobacteriaceae bacterium]
MKGSVLLGLGFLAQGLFSARFLIQLVKSEKKGEVLSPAIFWQLSLIASLLLMTYGAFRHDPVIVGGQLIGYFVYIRNLQLQGEWRKIPKILQLFFFGLPVLFLFYFAFFWHSEFLLTLNNPDIDFFLLTWGSIGQLIFTSRFLVQWYFSERKEESYFPLSFWYISMVGAMLIIIYAIVRKDAVLFIGQAFGMIVYLRNVMIHFGFQNKRNLNFLEKVKTYRMGLFLGVTAFFLFFNLNSWSVTESSEARYAQISKEMLQTGDWMHPQLIGIYHYHKPPMTYWITALSYKIFGVNPFAARFFLQIAILIQLFLVYRIGILLWKDKNKSFKAALLYASFPVVIIGGRALTTDAYLATFILAALFFWFRYLQRRENWDLIFMNLFLGLGFLTKGPVVLIVPVVLWVHQIVFSSSKIRFNASSLLGLLLFLIIGLSWFLMLWIEDSRFLDYFVFKHTIERFATNTFSRSQPFWFYIVILLLLAFPWFIILLSKSKTVFQKKYSLLSRFWIWVFVPLLFFSISQSKLVLYILPIFGGLAFGAVEVWGGLKESTQKRWENAQTVFQVLIVLALFISPVFEEVLHLSAKFYFLGVILLSLLLGLYLSGIKTSDKALLSAWMFTMMITAMSAYVFSNNPGMVNDTRRVVDWIEEHTPPSERIVIFDKRLPSIPFKTERSVISIYAGDESLNRETQFQKNEDWKKSLINLKDQPEWILESGNQKGIWVAKSNKEMPNLPDNLNWRILQDIDGWKIMQIVEVKQ